MNNFIDYFYKIRVQKINYYKKYYSFIYQGYMYKLYLLDSNINVNMLVNMNKMLVGHTLVSEIIINKDNEYISKFNKKSFILIKIFANVDNMITLDEINYLANSLYTLNLNINWGILWSRKIDYLEELINENGKKYPLIVDSFNYFVGMAENAIAYFNDINIEKDYKYVVSHKCIRLNDSIEVIYNPLNIIFDYRVRDIAEYIKNNFFLNNKDIFNELNIYIRKNPLSLTDVKLLIARLMYPSFYFELYDDILIYNQDERIIEKVINRLPEYEKYLAMVIKYFQKWYDVPEIPWLIRNNGK